MANKTSLRNLFKKCPDAGHWTTENINDCRQWQQEAIRELGSMISNPKNLAETFFGAERHIIVPQGFWWIVNLVFTFSGSRDPRWKDALNRNDRITIDIDERVRLARSGLPSSTFQSSRPFTATVPEVISAYRSFVAFDRKPIREGFSKIKDNDWYIQKEGSGFSYSLSKAKAINVLRAYLFPEMLRRHGHYSPHEIQKIRQRHVDNDVSGYLRVSQGNYSELKPRPIIGIYEVPLRHVLTYVEAEGEEEIIVTKPTKLLRYEPITYADAVSALRLDALSEHFRCDLHSVNEQKILKIIKASISKSFKDPQIRKALIRRAVGRFVFNTQNIDAPAEEQQLLNDKSELFEKKLKPALEAVAEALRLRTTTASTTK